MSTSQGRLQDQDQAKAHTTHWINHMVNARVPGPGGMSATPQSLEDGTTIRSLSPVPGPVGLGSPKPVGIVVPVATTLDWDTIKADFELWEALIQNLYLDSVNKVTVGVGNMLPSLAAAQALGFVLRSDATKSATREQIKTDWDKVNAESGKNKRATTFAKVTLLDLPVDDCWSLLKKRVDDEFLPDLRKIFDGWDNFPTPAKRALLDMEYNLGPGGFRKFKTLIAHAKKAEWKESSNSCERSGIPDERNAWTKARFLEAVVPAVKK